MIKSLLAANKSERDSFYIPQSVQQSIPIRRMYGDGIWQVGRKHSRTWRFADVNYAAASEEEQRAKDLDEYEKYTKSKKFIEDMAKTKLGLVNPDEIILKGE